MRLCLCSSRFVRVTLVCRAPSALPLHRKALMIFSSPLVPTRLATLPLFAILLLAGCASELTAPKQDVAMSAQQAKQPIAMQPRKPADMKSRIVRFFAASGTRQTGLGQ